MGKWIDFAMSSQVTRSLPQGREPPLPGLSVPLLQGSFVPLDLALFTWGAMLKTLWLFAIKHDFWGVMHTSWFFFQWFFRAVHSVWSVDDSQNSQSWVNVWRGHQRCGFYLLLQSRSRCSKHIFHKGAGLILFSQGSQFSASSFHFPPWDTAYEYLLKL